MAPVLIADPNYIYLHKSLRPTLQLGCHLPADPAYRKHWCLMFLVSEMQYKPSQWRKTQVDGRSASCPKPMDPGHISSMSSDQSNTQSTSATSTGPSTQPAQSIGQHEDDDWICGTQGQTQPKRSPFHLC